LRVSSFLEPASQAPELNFLSFKVVVGVCTAKGSGPNKKLAKRAAAEALLQELGYSPKPPGKGPFTKNVGTTFRKAIVSH
jgi:hypothetical protein